jgi:hypothetical protein
MVKKIVLIDPKNQKIKKTYDSRFHACKDLGIDNPYNIGHCLIHKTNNYKGYILKYSEEATKENILIWSEKYSRSLDGERRCFKYDILLGLKS